MILERRNPSRVIFKKTNLAETLGKCYAAQLAAALSLLSASHSAEHLNPPTDSTGKTPEAAFQQQSLIVKPQDLKNPTQDRLTIAGKLYSIRIESITELKVEGYRELDTKNLVYWRRNPDQTLRVSKVWCSAVDQAVLQINENINMLGQRL
jgi:hypothetical protein